MNKEKYLLAQAEMLSKFGTWELDLTNNSLYWSDGVFRICEYEPQEFVVTFEHGLSVIHPDDRERAIQQMQNTINTGKEYSIEKRFITKNNNIKHIISKGKLIKDENGNAIKLFGVFEDITEKIEAEKEKAASEQRYKLLFHKSPLPMWIYDLNSYQILEVNETAIQHYGYSREEFLKMTIMDYRPKHEIPEKEALLKKLETNSKVFDFGVSNHFKKDGTLIRAEITGYRMNFQDRDCMLVVCRDVTEEEKYLDQIKENEQKLFSSEQQLSLIYNTVSDILFSLQVEDNKRYKFISFNQAFLTATGLTAEQVMNKYVEDVIPEPSLSFVLSNYKKSIENKTKIVWEEETPYPTGTKIGIVTVTPVFNANGCCTHLIGSVYDITEQKRAQNDLQQRNIFIETALDNLPIGIAVNKIDEGTATIMNKTFSDIYGWPQEELTDVASFFEKVYPDEPYRKEIKERIIKDIQSGDPSKMNWEGITITTQKGEKRIVNAKNIPLYEQNLMISTVIDVTAQTTAEKELMLFNERYKYVKKATSDSIWDWDLAKGTLYRGEGFQNNFGHSISAVNTLENAWDAFIHPDDVQRVHTGISSVIESRATNWTDEYRYLKADGTYAYVLDKGFVIRDNEGRAIRMVGAMQDITKRKSEEHHLKLLESVITNTNDAVLITEAEPFDEPGPKIVYVNEAFTRMTGYTAEEIIGNTPRILQGPKSDKGELKKLSEAIRKWESCEITTINYKKNGEEFWINFSVSPVADEKGWFTHWIAIERDVTEKILLQNQLTNAIIKAQEDERYEIGGDLHDNVCQILVASQISLEMLKPTLTEKSPQWFHQCREYINQAYDEIRNISHRLAPAFFDDTKLEDTLKILLTSFQFENRCEVSLHIEKEVNELPIKRDLQLNLYRILQEQLRNIFKHAEASSISIDVVKYDGKLILTIADNGVGFDISTMKKGIGLANIKRRVELFSGKLEIESSPENGCKLIVQIPL
ncbi:MAG: PAS domain S-box protein [Bacteroidota bacterium]|nr:PAS domain S-box protein [Bacteroidota bacterium]